MSEATVSTEESLGEEKEALDLEEIWAERAEEHSLSPFEYAQLFFSYAFNSMRRNVASTFASIFVTALALFLSGSILLATKPLGELLFSADSLFPIKVYLSSQKKELVGAIIGKQQGVAEVKYISGEEAFKALVAKLGPDHPIFEGVDGKEKVLPDRYLVDVAPGSNKEGVFKNIKSALKNVPEVERISIQSELVRQVQKFTELLQLWGTKCLKMPDFQNLLYLLTCRRKTKCMVMFLKLPAKT